MTSSIDLIKILQAAQGKEWTNMTVPATEGDLEFVQDELEVVFPDVYYQLLLYSNGGELEGAQTFVSLYSTDLLIQMNSPDNRPPGLLDVTAFADDESSYVYFFDSRDLLGRGKWAIYGASVSAPNLGFSIYVADDLTGFVERVLDGDDLLDGPYVEDE